jgi:hypothetical protein
MNFIDKNLPVDLDKKVLRKYYSTHPYIKADTIKIRLDQNPISDLSQVGNDKVRIGALLVTSRDLNMIFPVFIYQGEIQPLDIALTNKSDGYIPITEYTYKSLLNNELAVGNPTNQQVDAAPQTYIDRRTGLPKGVSVASISNLGRNINTIRGQITSNALKLGSEDESKNIQLKYSYKGEEFFSMNAKNRRWLETRYKTASDTYEDIVNTSTKIASAESITTEEVNNSMQSNNVSLLPQKYVTMLDNSDVISLTIDSKTNPVKIKVQCWELSDTNNNIEHIDMKGSFSIDAPILKDLCAATGYLFPEEMNRGVVRNKYWLSKYGKYISSFTYTPAEKTASTQFGYFDLYTGDPVNEKFASMENDIDNRIISPIVESDLLVANAPVYLMKIAEDGTPLLSQPLYPYKYRDKYILFDKTESKPIRIRPVSGLKKHAAANKNDITYVYTGDDVVLVRLLTPRSLDNQNSITIIPDKDHTGYTISTDIKPYLGILNNKPLPVLNIDNLFIPAGFDMLNAILGYYGFTEEIESIIQDNSNPIQLNGVIHFIQGYYIVNPGNINDIEQEM